MNQPDKSESLKDKRILSRKSSFKQDKSGLQSKNPNNNAGHLQEKESWIKTIVDRLLGPIRFF